MKYFRINIYLKFKIYLFAFFLIKNKFEKKIEKLIKKNSKKKAFVLTSQLRVGFLLLLKYLKYKYPQKNEIIFLPYNLAEMINVAKSLNFKPIFSNLNYDSGFYDFRYLKKNIKKNTLALVLTNMFNSYEDTIKIKKFCKKNKIILIEDNAIYFDNFKIKKNNKIYTGRFGDYSLYSFNIMKNISALYGGGVSTNDIQFIKFCKTEKLNYSNFPLFLYIKQNLIYFFLKIISVNFIYKNFFFRIVKYAHLKKNLFLLKLFYPSLKFEKKKLPKYYFSNIANLSKKLIYLQLINKKYRLENHKIRKNKNLLYYNQFKKLKIKQIKMIPIKDFNFQNFMDFPILVKDKYKLNKFLLTKGIELKSIYYVNCSKLFKMNNKFSNAEKYEKKILCLPNHKKIKKEYIIFIVNSIHEFYRDYRNV